MAVRSVVDVDVNDDRFKAFLELFKQYQAGLKKTAPQWKASERAAEAAAQATAHITEQTKKRAGLQQQMDREREKADKAAAKAQQKRLDDAKKRLDNIKSTTSSIASNLLKGTASLLKWAGIGGVLGGLMGLGGFFGLDRLAASVGDARRSAQGLGITSGQQQAFNVNFGRYVDANQNLQSVADAKSNYADRWAFSAMGVNPTGKDPAQLAVEMALKAKTIFDKGDQSQQSAQAHGLLQFYSMDELRRLHTISMKELRGAETGYGRDSRGFSLADSTQRRWQDFSVQMGRAGQEIKNVFVDGLTPLVGPLEKLSHSVAETLESFMKNPHLKEWIDDFGKGIKSFGDYIGSDKFQSDVKTFVEDFASVTQKIADGLKLLGLIPGDAGGAPSTSQIVRDLGGWDEIWDREKHGKLRPGPYAMQVEKFFEQSGFARGGAAGITAQAMAETKGFDPFAKGDLNKNHQYTAYGMFQWHKARRDEYAKLFGHTMESVTDFDKARAEQLWFARYELTKGEFRKVGEQLKSMGADKGSLAGGMASEGWMKPGLGRAQQISEAKSRSSMANQIVVKVNNNTGGNANVQASQAAAG